MNRTTLLQERRMQTFHDVLGHWQARRLSALEAAELLGMSERSFRRYRQRYEEEGPDGLFDRRLGKASARRVPADRVEWVLDEYRTRYRGWTVKHFHDRLRDRHGFAWSYTWTKTTLRARAWSPRRPGAASTVAGASASPVGMMSRTARVMSGWPVRHHSIVTMDDSEIYSAFLVEEEGTASTFRALKQVFTAKACPVASTQTEAATTSTPPRPAAKWTRATRPRSAAPSTSSASNTSPPTRPRRAAAPSAPSEPSRTAWSRNSASPASPRSRPQTASSKRATCPTTTGASQQSPSSKPAPSCHRLHPTRSRGPHAHKARGRARRAPRKTGPANPRQPGQAPLRQGHGPGARVSRRHTRPLPRTQMPRPLSGRRRAHRHTKAAGRVSRFDAACRRPVDKWTAAPRLTTSPQGQPQQQKRTIDVLQKPAKYTC